MDKEMMADSQPDSQRVLFLPQNPRDARTAQGVFEASGTDLCVVEDLSGLIERLEDGAGCLIVAEERLAPPDFRRLVNHLLEQPSWSDLPVLVVTRADRTSQPAEYLTEIANTTLIERPVRINTLLSTVRAALRDRRRQYDLRRSIANRDQFLAMLGHELRNPLAAIVLALDQLAAEDVQSPALDIVQRQSRNLERIVDDLLEVSRISRGVISFEKEDVDLAELARETVDAFLPIAREQDITLRQTLPESPLWVHGDAVRLEQVLGNLLSNAVRYTPSGGRIEVRGRGDDDEVVLSVRDTGIGIPADKIDDIFQLFGQAHRESARSEGGLGLGLSLANSIVEEHDGELTVESAGQGQGSEFAIHLPASTPARPDDAQPLSGREDSHSGRPSR